MLKKIMLFAVIVFLQLAGISAQTPELSKHPGEYLGMLLSGEIPEVFTPGLISTAKGY